MIWNLNRPALDHDILGWAESSGPWTPEREREFSALVRLRQTASSQPSQWLDGFHNAQRRNAGEPLPGGLDEFLRRPGPTFLLGPNVVGDSATLGRETIFPSQRAWLESVCAFVRERPDINLVIRAHPDEITRRELHVRVADVARRAAGDAPNVFILDSSDHTNTFAIIPRVRAGLVWTSTLGPDMVMQGKPVLVAARAPYLALGVGTAAASREEYFQKLLGLAAGAPPPDQTAVTASKRYQWILYHDLSLEAIPPQSSRTEEGSERQRFYRILAGELGPKGLPL
jgi:hypothetical protein